MLAFKQSILDADYQFALELRNQINSSLLSVSDSNSLQLTSIALLHLNPSSGVESTDQIFLADPQMLEALDPLAALESRVPNPLDVAEWNYYMAATQEALGNNRVAAENYYLCTRSRPTQIDYQSRCSEFFWALLLDSDANHSEDLAKVDSNYRAWIELANLVTRNTGLIEYQTSALDRWLVTYSNHPARANPPSELLDLIRSELNAPLSIALILPLSGRLQAAGEAVLDGFLSAAYLTGTEGYQAPAIEIFDSGSLPIELIAEIISEQNFDFAIGPLDGENVDLFAGSISAEIPVLYLNRVSPENRPSMNHLGYSLAVESEAQQAAQTSIAKGHKNALVLIEDSAIGERAAGAFAQDWVEGDRKIYDLVRLSDATTLTERLEQSFHVNQSEQRKSQLQTLLGKALEFTPRRRQDIDTIFLASNSILARQVTPTLAFLFAQDVPVLATSRVFDENSDSENNRDLAALRFLSPPWLVNTGEPLAQQSSDRPLELQKLEAMGVDAFYLSRRFQQFEDPAFSYQGKTGSIFIGNDGNLRRTMEWVRIDGDKIVLAE